MAPATMSAIDRLVLVNAEKNRQLIQLLLDGRPRSLNELSIATHTAADLLLVRLRRLGLRQLQDGRWKRRGRARPPVVVVVAVKKRGSPRPGATGHRVAAEEPAAEVAVKIDSNPETPVSSNIKPISAYVRPGCYIARFG
jgi:hypothetical protein